MKRPASCGRAGVELGPQVTLLLGRIACDSHRSITSFAPLGVPEACVAKTLWKVLAALTFTFVVAAAQTPDSTPSNLIHTLADSEVRAAITLGQSSNGPFGYFAMSGTTLQVLALGPVGRIATAAAKAKRAYLPFPPESVSTDLRAPLLVVTASPRPSRGRMLFDVEHVVIRGLSRGNSALIQPLRVERHPTTWTNRLGGQVVAQDVWAYFNTSVLSLDDLVIVVVTNDGEAKFKVKDNDRAKLQ